MLAVALLAGFLFIGGAAAIYLSNPPGSAAPTNIAVGSGSPTLPPFVQQTASPAPTPSPTFILLPSESPSFSPLPTSTAVGPTAPPTPIGQTPPPATPRPVDARFNCSQQGTSRTLKCQENSTGNVTSFQWDFGEGPTSTDRNASHTYETYGEKTVTLTVTDPNGATDSRTRTFVLNPPTPSPTPGPTATPTASPLPSPSTPVPQSVEPTVTVESTATPSPDATGTPAP